MAKKSLYELLSDLSKDIKDIKIQDYTKPELADTISKLYSKIKDGLKAYSDQEISNEFYKRYKNHIVSNINHDTVLITKNKINSYTISEISNIKNNLNSIFENKDYSTCEESQDSKTVRLDKDQFDALIRAIYVVGGYAEGDNNEKR